MLHMLEPEHISFNDAIATSLCELFCSSLVSKNISQSNFGSDGLKWLQKLCTESTCIPERFEPLHLSLSRILSRMQTALTVYRYSFIGCYILANRSSSSGDQRSVLPAWGTEFLKVLSVHNMDFHVESVANPSKKIWETPSMEANIAAARAMQDSAQYRCKHNSEMITTIRDDLQHQLSQRYPVLVPPGKDYKLDHSNFGELRTHLRTLLYYAEVDSVSHILVPAAAANWHEIVQALLELGVPPGYNSAFDQCLQFNSADAARVLVETGEFEGYVRDIIIGTARHGSDRVLRNLLRLGMCKIYKVASSVRERHGEEPPLTTYGDERNDLMTVAATSGHIDILDALLQIDGISLNHRDGRGLMPVHHAAARSAGEMWPVLLQLRRLGADISAKDFQGMTPMMHAAKTGHLDVLEELLKERSVVSSLMDEGGKTVLFHLLSRDMKEANKEEKEKSVKLLRIMRGLGLDPSTPVSGYTTLMVAAAAGNAHLIHDLLSEQYRDYDYVLNLVNNHDSTGRTALYFAAEAGHISTIQELLQQSNLDLGLTDQSSWTALSVAAAKGHWEVVKFLLEDPKMEKVLGTRASKHPTTPSGGTKEDSPPTMNDHAILASSRSGNVRTLKLLLEDGRIDPDARLGVHSVTALYGAVLYERTEAVKILLSSGRVNPNIAGDWGNTPLHTAVRIHDVETAKLLLEAGAKVDITDTEGRTALDLAKETQMKAMRDLFTRHEELSFESDDRSNKKERAALSVEHEGVVGDLRPRDETLSLRWRD